MAIPQAPKNHSSLTREHHSCSWRMLKLKVCRIRVPPPGRKVRYDATGASLGCEDDFIARLSNIMGGERRQSSQIKHYLQPVPGPFHPCPAATFGRRWCRCVGILLHAVLAHRPSLANLAINHCTAAQGMRWCFGAPGFLENPPPGHKNTPSSDSVIPSIAMNEPTRPRFSLSLRNLIPSRKWRHILTTISTPT